MSGTSGEGESPPLMPFGVAFTQFNCYLHARVYLHLRELGYGPHLVSCLRNSLHNSRDISPKISPYPSFPKRGLGVDGEESPFEKGETGGFESDFSRCIVWTSSTNFRDTTLGPNTTAHATRSSDYRGPLEHLSLIKISVDWLLATMLGEVSPLARILRSAANSGQQRMTGIEVAPLGQDDVHVRIASLDYPQSEMKYFENILAEDEINRANRFHFRKDRERFVAGRGLLRIILSSYLGVRPGEMIFTYGSHGKPELRAQDGRSAIQFNLAHSGGTAIYAITQNRPVGVDIESFQVGFPVEEVARNFFSVTEFSALHALPNTSRTEAFFKCWTRKEAVIKALGDGLSCPLRDFDVSLAPGEPARLLHVRWGSEEASRWCMEDIDCVAGCAAAIAFSGPQCSVYVSPWEPMN